MFFSRVLETFGAQGFEGADDAETSVAGFDNVVDVAIFSGNVRIGECFGVFGFLFVEVISFFSRVFDIFNVFAVKDFNGALATHNCDFSGRPSVVDIAAEVFRAHYAVSAAVVFTKDDGNFGNGSFAVGVE